MWTQEGTEVLMANIAKETEQKVFYCVQKCPHYVNVSLAGN